MRYLLINKASPYSRHVSGVRLHRFAQCLVTLGHEVMLLTEARGDDGARPRGTPAAPFPVPTVNGFGLQVVEIGGGPAEGRLSPHLDRMPTVVRRLRTAWRLLVKGGVSHGWVSAARDALPRLLSEFRPDLVWATFGETSNLVLAQHVARLVDCPWVADIKDNWEIFIPRGLRRAVAFRFRDAAALTANAALHMKIARGWHAQRRARVLYSGVDDCFFLRRRPANPGSDRTLLLLGSTYSERHLLDFMDGLSRWLARLDGADRRTFRFRYVGSDAERVAEAVRDAGLSGCSSVSPSISVDELAQAMQASFLNCYIWNQSTFHHKLLELLVAGRPVLAYPGEHEESLDFCARSSTPFHVCMDKAGLMDKIDEVWAASAFPSDAFPEPPDWTWSSFAEDLDDFFLEVIDEFHQAAV